MASHEFGIMKTMPRGDENFQSYEPEKYGCISIDDEHIENLVSEFEDIVTYWHRLSWKMTGLNYIGITLIPPKSCGALSEIFKAQKSPVYDELCGLLDKAKAQEKFVIHYGL